MVQKLLTAGRCDAYWREGDVLCVADWKTGATHYGPPEKVLQLWVPAFALAQRFGMRKVRIGIYYAQDGVWEWSEDIDLESGTAVDAWRDVVAAAQITEDPNPGDWCGDCFEKRKCEHKRMSPGGES